MTLKIEKITESIIHLNMPTQKEIASLLIRFQEYYESHIPEIKGQIFTLGYLKHKYSTFEKVGCGAFTYMDGLLFSGDWNGFNFPGHVMQPFIQGLFDPLTPGEQDLVELFRYRNDDFYIIGTHGKEKGAIDHEICHGLYYTHSKYRKEVNSIIDTYITEYEDTSPGLSGFEDMLKSWGYCDDVIIDEMHAYISADYDWFEEKRSEDLEKFDIQIPKELHKHLRKIKKKYFKPLNSKYLGE
jgi:hypothetical protein